MKLSLSFHFNQRNQRHIDPGNSSARNKFMQMKMRWTTGFKINKFFARVYWIPPKYYYALSRSEQKCTHFLCSARIACLRSHFGRLKSYRPCYCYRPHLYVRIFWISKTYNRRWKCVQWGRMESCSVFNERIRSISCDNNNQNLWCNLIVVLFEAIKIMRCTVYTRFSRTRFYVPCLVLTNDNKYGIQCDNRNLNFTIETFYHRIIIGMYTWRKHTLIWTSHKVINSVNNFQWNSFRYILFNCIVPITNISYQNYVFL